MTDDIKKEIQKCVKCGTCKPVCPVFEELRREYASPRGRIAIAEAIISGELKPSKEAERIITRCLSCLECVDTCPNDINIDKIFLSAKEKLFDGKNVIEKISSPSGMFGLKSLNKILKGVSVFQGVALKKARKDAFILRRPFRMFGTRIFPEIKKKFFIDKYPEFMEGDSKKETIGFYVGCLINFVYPEIGEGVVHVLKKAGFSIYIPKEQYCCGLPLLSEGNVEPAERLSKLNTEGFGKKKIDYVVSACASCGSTLKKQYGEDFADKVIDITQLIQKFKIDLTVKKEYENKIVTFHEPCHLKRGMKAGDTARELIRKLFGANFAEMKDPAKCCGFGGSFSVRYAGVSKRILDRKIKSIENTEAKIVLTDCPGCIYNIHCGLFENGIKAEVLHILQVVE